ncbi:hypothetical protein AVV27_gp31 [Achromobacter phage 83-24]|uniref:Uncharacterized protein n=1 Tax=Achromobacter phage 83-24 TaxID=1589747 RepID=A0A0B5A4G5_9CAUD|nr:hypothetical protein AVV27_gp31 [Achromobacter phage 83-24]AJD82864.1 hypothetical protein JWAP_00031 [Achromobacter phage 83-24]
MRHFASSAPDALGLLSGCTSIVSAMAGVALTLSMLTGQSIVEQNKMQEIYDQSLQHIKQEADARVQEANEKFKAIIDRLPPSVVTSAVRGAKIEIKP